MDIEPTRIKKIWRNYAGFWLFGFLNSILSYIIFFSSHYSEIHTHLLIAVPSCILKVLPLFISGYLRSQVIALSSLHGISSIIFLISSSVNSLGYIIVGTLAALFITLLAAGFGEAFFLSYSSYYDKNVITAWTSGKGAAGILGILIWITMDSKNLRPILPIVSIPLAIINLLVYFYLLEDPNTFIDYSENITEVSEHQTELIGLRNKINYIPKLFKYMIPLGLAVLFQTFGALCFFTIELQHNFFLENFSNFLNTFHGFLISGTFSSFLKLKTIWILPNLQLLIFLILLGFSLTKLVPGNWFILIVMFWTGLLEGCVYVKTFERIYDEEHPARKKFSLGMTTFITSIGFIIGDIAANNMFK